MFHNIIKASGLRGLKEANVLIGGVGSIISSPSLLTSTLGIPSDDFENFKTNGIDISFYLKRTFNASSAHFSYNQNPVLSESLTYFILFTDRYIINVNSYFDTYNRNPDNLKFFYSESDLNEHSRIFGDRGGKNRFFVQRNLSDYPSEGGFSFWFTNTNSTNLKTKWFVEDYGYAGLDNDINYFLNRNVGEQVNFILDRTTPNAATISANTIGGTYVELNVSQPTHVNTLKYALVFLDGFFQDVYDINNVFVFNLQEQTSYDIKVIIADEYFNISPYSNTLNVTTTTTPALFQNAVAYYKLDETSGDAIDVVNGYNGTLFGGVTQGVAGKIGKAIESDAVGDKYFEIPVEAFDENNFHTSGWFYYDSVNGDYLQIMTRGNGGNGLRIEIDNIIRVVYLGVAVLPTSLSNAIDNDWNHYVISKNGNNIKIYINSVLEFDETETYQNSGTSLKYGINLNADGTIRTGEATPFKLDEIDHRTTPYTAGERLDLYNNNSGTTI